MKYIPILYSTPMVRALLQGRKTQTRRLRGLDKINERPDDVVNIQYVLKLDGSNETGVLFTFNKGEKVFVKCPFGEPGDVLWVRETWARPFICGPNDKEIFLYKANIEHNQDKTALLGYKWKPSIHMPKEVCRLFLKNKIIKCERLQSISEGDAMAEGINPYTHNPKWNGISNVDVFRDLWISIHGKASWELNPWVWAIDFEQITREEAAW